MNTRQRITLFIITIACLALAATIGATAASRTAAKKAQQKATLAAQAKIRRGEYLVRVGGCNDCHTPHKLGANGIEPDQSRLLSGHPESLVMPPPPKLGKGPWVWSAAGTNTAFAGPWGVSYTANLTPDRLTGLGIWTEEMFIKTLRTGRHWGVSRPILPPMPWQNFAGMSDEDLSAIFAYLRSIKPVRNQVPDPVIAPPPPAAKPARHG